MAPEYHEEPQFPDSFWAQHLVLRTKVREVHWGALQASLSGKKPSLQ